MPKKIRRKFRPEPPRFFWADTDGCWDCPEWGRGCSGCKRLKEYNKVDDEKRKRSEKIEIKELTKCSIDDIMDM